MADVVVHVPAGLFVRPPRPRLPLVAPEGIARFIHPVQDAVVQLVADVRAGGVVDAVVHAMRVILYIMGISKNLMQYSPKYDIIYL